MNLMKNNDFIPLIYVVTGNKLKIIFLIPKKKTHFFEQFRTKGSWRFVRLLCPRDLSYGFRLGSRVQNGHFTRRSSPRPNCQNISCKNTGIRLIKYVFRDNNLRDTHTFYNVYTAAELSHLLMYPQGYTVTTMKLGPKLFFDICVASPCYQTVGSRWQGGGNFRDFCFLHHNVVAHLLQFKYDGAMVNLCTVVEERMMMHLDGVSAINYRAEATKVERCVSV